MEHEEIANSSTDSSASELSDVSVETGPDTSSASCRGRKKRKGRSGKKFRGAYSYCTKFDVNWIAKHQQCKGSIRLHVIMYEITNSIKCKISGLLFVLNIGKCSLGVF